jgi:hypothetical protein
MRSFRARIERGRIIVHEPIDFPDGVVYLVVADRSAGDSEKPPPADLTVAVVPVRLDAPPDSAREVGHGSSS